MKNSYHHYPHHWKFYFGHPNIQLAKVNCSSLTDVHGVGHGSTISLFSSAKNHYLGNVVTSFCQQDACLYFIAWVNVHFWFQQS